MGLTVDQHRELVVNDIRQALQHVFGEHFEIVDIETTARSAYGPTFILEVHLEEYKTAINMLVEGNDVSLLWGLKDSGWSFCMIEIVFELALERSKLIWINQA